MYKEDRNSLFAVAFGFAIWLAMASASIFVTGSLVTSGVKAVSGQCGKSFGIPVVSQDWFCAK